MMLAPMGDKSFEAVEIGTGQVNRLKTEG